MEAVPNVSEGRRIEVLGERAAAAAGRGAQLLQAHDDVARDIVLLHRLGIFDSDDAAERSRLCAKYVRSAYASGFEALGKVRGNGRPGAGSASAPAAEEEALQ
jgi:DNA-directed RNA polymerase specialized sigma24 family protein